MSKIELIGGENMEFVIGYIIGLVLTGILIIVVSGRGF
nr:MAG TPA: Tetrahydromethanopterin S-methyltransferase, subunit G [Caudoviricetes sp.]